MSMLDFFHTHWFLAFICIMAVATLAGVIVQTPFYAWNRWLRYRNIKTHGWPPPHLNADGDWKKNPKKDGE